VAVGGDNQTGAAVWVSPDGRVWERVPHDPAVFGAADPASLSSGRMQAVAAAGPGLVAVGTADGKSAVWVSSDGLVWERVFAGEEHEVLMDVAARQGRLYAVGYFGVDDAAQGVGGPASLIALASEDGLVWERLARAGDTGEAVEALGGQWLEVLGPLGTVVEPDGGAPGGWAVTMGHGMRQWPTTLLEYEGRLLAADGRGAIWGSADDGAAWSRLDAFEGGTGAAFEAQFVSDLLAIDGDLLAFGYDVAWSADRDLGGGDCLLMAGHCRADAAVWIATWDQG
jgi:hypothetical protein